MDTLSMRRRRTLATWGLMLLPLGLLGACAVADAGGAAAAAPLRGTTWVMVPLRGALPPAAAPGPRAPQLLLDPEQPRATGHTGCNRLMAGFDLDGQRLRLRPAATTRMACMEGANPEPQFLQALQDTRGWRIEGRVLWLLGEDERPVMRLQAAP
jgi:heat shock protein HslJ